MSAVVMPGTTREVTQASVSAAALPATRSRASSPSLKSGIPMARQGAAPPGSGPMRFRHRPVNDVAPAAPWAYDPAP